MSWRTKDDVLKDLGAVNGRRTGAEHLDRHVVKGDLPPPIVHESVDNDELSYFTSGYATGGLHKEPDLPGISAMLKIVNADSEDHEPNILYRNTATDEIRISKLNPLAGEYVPPGFNRPQAGQHQNPKRRGSPNKRQNAKVKPNVPEPVNGDVPGFNGGRHATSTTAVPEQLSPFSGSMFKPRHKKIEQTTTENKATMLKSPTESSKTVTIPNHSAQPNVLPNKVTDTPSISKMETKTEDIKEIQQKIKSTILASSNDNSLNAKRQKNVAIAALLKLGSIPQAADEQPVKLIKPDYFERPPSKKDLDIQIETADKVEELVIPSTSNSEIDLNYKDLDSESKVTGWFDAMERPKQRYVPQPKPVLRESVTFKRKETSSASSKTSEASKEKQEPVDVPKAISFKPSSYATDLLKKYESNAQKVVLREDLGERLERQLKERDEVIRQKMLANTASG